MPGGTGTVTSSNAYPGGVAVQLIVARYKEDTTTGGGGGGGTGITPSLASSNGMPFSVVPNVECLGFQVREGADPGVARLRYRLSTSSLNPAWPRRIEDIIGLDAKVGPYVLGIDERIVVLQIDPPVDGSDQVQYTVLFCGTTQVPQANVSGDTEQVTLQAIGIAARCWERPIAGAVYRSDSDPAKNMTTNDVATLRPTRFNPDGKPNATALNYWTKNTNFGTDAHFKDDDKGLVQGNEDDADGESSTAGSYPVFLDIPEDGFRAAKYFDFWSISGAVRYLLATYNGDEKDVQNPEFASLGVLLDSFEVADGATFDPTDTSTFTENVVTVEDYDATGDPWPVAIEKLITPYGFGFRFRLDEDHNGLPVTRLEFYRTDAADGMAPKYVYLPEAGSDYDPAACNAATVDINRDVAGLFNQVVVDTELSRRECSFVLSPGFRVGTAADITSTQFNYGDPNNPKADPNAYRTFLFDEDGAGHFNHKTSAFVIDKPTSLDDLFGKPKADPNNPNGPAVPTYAIRPRKPLGTLFSKDQDDGSNLRAQLHVSPNPSKEPPYLYDGKGDWQLVSPGSWELLPNRIGIKFTIDKPTELQLPRPPIGPGINAKLASDGAGKLNLIKALAGPDDAHPWPTFRLTCVIESDQTIGITAKRRVASTSPRTIERRVDCRDRFVQHVIDSSSYLNTTGFDVLAQDDTDDAQSYADALREAHECAPISGTIMIPRVTLSYGIGDQIKGIYGRDVSLRINQGAPTGEAAQYPVVSAIDYNFDGVNTTTIHLTSRQVDPPPERRR